MAPKQVFIGLTHTKFTKNQYQSHKIHKKKIDKINKNQKINFEKHEKKCGQTQQEKFQNMRFLNSKFGILKMNPILEDIQIDHKTRSTRANYLFEGVNHTVIMGLTDEKKITTSNYLCF